MNKHILPGILNLIIIIAVTASLLPLACFADEDEGDRLISVPFYSPARGILEWQFPYSDDYFENPSEIFSQDLARASIGLAVSAFRKEVEELSPQYETYLKGAGFTDIHTFGYDQETSADTLSGVIGHKLIGDTILIAAAPAGQGYVNEWAGNLEVGDEERHVGFNKAAGIMEEQILAYIDDHDLKGKMKLWLTGFSRASAVSNLTAADMIDKGIFEDVYACLFAVPRTTRDPECREYSGIFNICGIYDPVPQIPPESWGYERYGTDLYMPTTEMNSNYPDLYINTFNVSYELTGDIKWYNPEISYQLHLIIEFIAELFPDSTSYAEKFQDIIMDLWRKTGDDTFALILIEAVSRLEELDQREAYSSEVFIDYLTYLSSQYLNEDQTQVKNGWWNPEQSIMENMMREHMPYTYITWLFSDNTVEQLYEGPDITRRLYIYGNVDVDVYTDGKLLRGIDSSGNIKIHVVGEEELEDEETRFLNVFMMRHGMQTVVCLPLDRDFKVNISTGKTESIVYYDVICTPYLTYGIADTMFTASLKKGEYSLDIPLVQQEMYKLQPVSGEILSSAEFPMNYSTTMIMLDESNSAEHMTLSDLLLVFIMLLMFIAVLMFVCLIIAIIHAIRKRKRNKSYSPWFVIVPHLLLIIAFAILTQYFTYNLYTLGIARVIATALTMITLFLLALRGLLRNRNIPNLVIAALLLAVGMINTFLYQNSSMVSSYVLHVVIYGLILAGLCVLASSTFFRKRKKHLATSQISTV